MELTSFIRAHMVLYFPLKLNRKLWEDPNWPRAYSILYKVTLPSRSWVRRRDVCVWPPGWLMSGAWLDTALRGGEQLPCITWVFPHFFPSFSKVSLSQPSAFALLLCTVMLGKEEGWGSSCGSAQLLARVNLQPLVTISSKSMTFWSIHHNYLAVNLL